MSHTPTSVFTRRDCLTMLTGLSAASFAGGDYRTEAQEARNQRTPYSAPQMRFGQDIAYLRNAPVCKATRYGQGVPPTCASKIFVERDGTLHLKTLPFLERSGWMTRWRSMTKVKLPPLRNPTYSDPDIRASHASGVILTLQQGAVQREVYLSNEHHLRNAAWEIEDKAVYDWHYDLGVISTKEIKTNLEDPSLPPRGRLADTSVTNGNLCSKSVEVVGFGSDLFKFVGTPFRLPYFVTTPAPSVKAPDQQHLFFGIKVPGNFLRDIAEIGGMSGSPVVLNGTNEVVGTVCRAYAHRDGDKPIFIIVFTGPDEVRRIVSRAENLLER